jgi:hypothetical protein
MKFVLTLLMLVTASEAFANNYFIPNHYRNRREVNHFTATAWSTRREVGLQYKMQEADIDQNGVKLSEWNTKGFRPYVFYKSDAGIGVDADLLRDRATIDDTSDNEDDSFDIDGLNVNAGYEVPGRPMAFSLGLRKLGTEFTDKPGTTTLKSDSKAIDLGFGYKLANDIYLGGGVSVVETVEGLNEDKGNFNVLTFGAGKVFGGGEKPMATVESTLEYYEEQDTKNYELLGRGLYNMDNFQFYGELAYDWASGDLDSTGYQLTAGADMQFDKFYVGPQVSKITDDTDSDTEDDTDVMTYSLEAGARIESFEGFLRYTKSDLEAKQTGAKLENATTEILLGASYKFQ